MKGQGLVARTRGRVDEAAGEFYVSGCGVESFRAVSRQVGVSRAACSGGEVPAGDVGACPRGAHGRVGFARNDRG